MADGLSTASPGDPRWRPIQMNVCAQWRFVTALVPKRLAEVAWNSQRSMGNSQRSMGNSQRSMGNSQRSMGNSQRSLGNSPVFGHRLVLPVLRSVLSPIVHCAKHACVGLTHVHRGSHARAQRVSRTCTEGLTHVHRGSHARAQRVSRTCTEGLTHVHRGSHARAQRVSRTCTEGLRSDQSEQFIRAGVRARARRAEFVALKCGFKQN
ncbi:unnamed protein product [Knipowitschia caucasica]